MSCMCPWSPKNPARTHRYTWGLARIGRRVLKDLKARIFLLYWLRLLHSKISLLFVEGNIQVNVLASHLHPWWGLLRLEPYYAHITWVASTKDKNFSWAHFSSFLPVVPLTHRSSTSVYNSKMLLSTRVYSSLFFSVFYLSLSIAQSNNRACYWPDGSAVANNEVIPCANGDSQCCSAGDGCVSNGLCFSGFDGIVQSSPLS